jgi:HPt (histidine-containing phosphotransfer) domain-containing protein
MVAIASNRSKTREFSAAERGFADAEEAHLSQPNEPVIDLVHLSRQTMSDQALELELLDLFERQSARIVAQLKDVGASDAKLCGDLAHTLRGSALAIGAARVARSAQVYEASCSSQTHGAAARAALDALADSVAEARATIADLLGR